MKLKNLLYAFLFILASAVNAQTNYFVSKTTGSDATGNGQTWQTAFATVEKALTTMGYSTNNGQTYNIYVAKGDYAFPNRSGGNRIFKGNKMVKIFGGLPIPTEDTPPDYTCAPNPIVYPTSFSYGGNDSLFRIAENGNPEEVNSTDLHLEGINFSNTTTDASTTDGSFLTLDGKANHAHVTLENMIISGYQANGAGFIYVYYTNNSSVTIRNTHVSGGKEEGVVGGAFIRTYGENPNFMFKVEDSVFKNNKRVNIVGGSLFEIENNDINNNIKVVLLNSTFCGNSNSSTAVGVIGAVLKAERAAVTIQGNEFSNNTVAAGVINLEGCKYPLPFKDNKFISNKSTKDAGAINIQTAYSATAPDAKLIIENNKFHGNTANSDGGAIYVGANNDTGVELEIIASEFLDNKANTDGGAILLNSEKNVTIRNSQFCNNQSSGDGGAIKSKKGASYLFSIGNTYTSNTATRDGGAIFALGNLKVENSWFYRNKATRDGGAIRSKDPSTGKPLIEVVNSNFRENTSALSGGAISLNGNNIETTLPVSITTSKFQANSSTGGSGGGAIYMTNVQGSSNQGAISITSSDFFNNKVSGGNITNNGTYGGGALYVEGDWNNNSNEHITTFTGNKFAGNTVNGQLNSGFKIGGSDIKLRYTKIAVNAVTGNAFQLSASNYTNNTSNWEGYYNVAGGSANSYSNAAITDIGTPVVACPVRLTAICPTAADILDPAALITTSKGTITAPVTNSVICSSEAPTTKIKLFAPLGKPGFTFSYQIVTINGGTQTTSTSAPITVSTVGTSKEVDLDLPTTIPTEGISYRYEILSITDATNKTTTYTCTPRLSATISIQPEPKISVGQPANLCVGETINLSSTFTKTETMTSAMQTAGGKWSNSTTATWSWTGPNSYTSTVQSPVITNATLAMAGTYTLTVTDNNGCIKTATVEVKVSSCVNAQNDVNVTPKGKVVVGNVLTNDTGAVSVSSMTGLDASGNSIAISTDANAPTTIYAADGQVAGKMSYNATTGDYSFEPSASFTGDVPVKYTAQRTAGAESTATLTIKVTDNTSSVGANTPVVVDDTATVQANEGTSTNSVSVNVLANDSSTDGNALSVSSVSAITSNDGTTTSNISTNSAAPTTVYDKSGSEAGTAYLDSTGKVVFTPKEGYTGNVPFTTTVTDNASPTPQTATSDLTVTVAPRTSTEEVYPNDDAQTFKEGTTEVTGNVLVNDTTSGAGTTAVTGGTVNGIALTIGTEADLGLNIGKLTLNANGTYTFKPAYNFVGTIPVVYNSCVGTLPNQSCKKATLYLSSLAKSVCVFTPTATGTDAVTPIGISTQEHNTENWVTDRNGFIKLESQKLGFIPTRLSTIQRNGLTAAQGMMIWNTDNKCLEIYTGTEWKCVTKGCNK